ncbi:putative bifunctional diguanylate cyclase/phosphodiesterase [Caenispirillum bisanense]|uniref:putative bifunctional diguanylate cyclase/phosphodiesterase n=1 Tax=Caenispirillum bisanense TaxID=414052 RepID=UPI0031D9EBD4
MAGAATPPTPTPPPARFGIRAKLWLAFVAIAGMSVLVTGLAWATFARTATVLDGFTAERIPGVVALSQLAQRANALVGGAPSIIFAETDLQLAAESAKVAQAEEAFLAAHRQVAQALGETVELRRVGEAAARASANLQLLRSAMRHRRDLAAQQAALLEQLDVLHQEYRLLVAGPGESGGLRWAFLTEINRLLVLLAGVRDAETAADVSRQLRTIDTVLRSVETLKDEHLPAMTPQMASAMASFLQRLRGLAAGSDGLPALRGRELAATEVAAARFADLQRQAGELATLITALTSEAQQAAGLERAAASTMLTRSKVVLAVVSAAALAGALLIAWLYVGRSVVRRLSRLDHSMRAIAAGDLDHPVPVDGSDEVTAMGQALATFRDAMGRAAHLARHDPLTGLGNRMAFEAAVTERLAVEESGAVIFLNLDGFKDINDTFGHSTGDRVLVAVAERLRRRVRPGDVVARLGGDDFAVVAAALNDSDGNLAAYVDQFAQVLAQPVDVEGLSIEVRGAFGISYFPRDGRRPADLLSRAELAMNSAKAEPVGRVRVYTPRLGEQQQERKAIRGELRRAIDDGQFRLLYQPKIDISSGACVGMEALVRWEHPQRGRINPAQFIPVAERSGLIVPLGEWVMHEACRQNRAWREAGLPPLKVAVNVSAVQFLCQDVVEMVERALHGAGLGPESLEVEITESVIMTDGAKVLRMLDGLRSLGVSLAIDDFGTGYSSLSYLKRLRVTCLKIDQSFVREMLRNEDDVRITRAIMNIARDFGLEVVAEGIETADHVAFFRSEGCHLGQGYYWGKPMESGDFQRFIADSRQAACA